MHGVYRFTRNPMYLGMTVLTIGGAVWVNTAWILILLVPALAVMRWHVIAREEAYLEAKFGSRSVTTSGACGGGCERILMIDNFDDEPEDLDTGDGSADTVIT